MIKSMGQSSAEGAAAAMIIKTMNYIGSGHWPEGGVTHVRGLVKAGNTPQQLPYIKGFADHMMRDDNGNHGTKELSKQV